MLCNDHQDGAWAVRAAVLWMHCLVVGCIVVCCIYRAVHSTNLESIPSSCSHGVGVSRSIMKFESIGWLGGSWRCGLHANVLSWLCSFRIVWFGWFVLEYLVNY